MVSVHHGDYPGPSGSAEAGRAHKEELKISVLFVCSVVNHCE